MTENFATSELNSSSLDQERFDQVADATTGTTAKDDVLGDILSLDQGETQELVDLLADRIASTPAPGTDAVSMAGGGDSFQDGDPKDGPDDDIIKALKEQGFIKEAPDPVVADPSDDFADPEFFDLHDRIRVLADSEVSNGGFDSAIELWI